MRGGAALLGAVAVALALATAGSAVPPTTSYHWVQPWCAPIVTPGANLPSTMPAGATPVQPPVPGADYHWAQPGCATHGTGAALPPWMPVG